MWSLELSVCGVRPHVGLHRVHQEAELVPQGLVAVRHPDLGHVGPPDLVALRAALQVVGADEVLLLLEVKEKVMQDVYLQL